MQPCFKMLIMHFFTPWNNWAFHSPRKKNVYFYVFTLKMLEKVYFIIGIIRNFGFWRVKSSLRIAMSLTLDLHPASFLNEIKTIWGPIWRLPRSYWARKVPRKLFRRGLSPWYFLCLPLNVAVISRLFSRGRNFLGFVAALIDWMSATFIIFECFPAQPK